MYDYLIRAGKPKEAEVYLDKALARFDLYEKLDPVYPLNYYRKAQIYIQRKDFAAAEREYQHDLYAWKCFVPGHLHATPEAYTNLANAEFALGKYAEAAGNYRQALVLNPAFEQARRNLAIVQSRVSAVPSAPGKR